MSGTTIYGFGEGPFGLMPFGGSTTDPQDTPRTIVGAWLIDERTMRYVLDEHGNPVAMDGTAQRVLLAVVEADLAIGVIAPTELSRQEQAYRAALEPLVSDNSIAQLAVSVVSTGTGAVTATISYFNRATSLPVTLVL